jgi:hypothetical protein
VQEVEHLGQSDVRDGLVDDLLRLNGRDADGEGRPEHRPALVDCMVRDDRGELDHQPGAGVQIAVLQHLVEGEVVEDLDQLGVGDLERRDVTGKQFVVIALRSLTDRDACTPLGKTHSLSVTCGVWQQAWVCHAVRAQGAKRTVLTRIREGSSPFVPPGTVRRRANYPSGGVAQRFPALLFADDRGRDGA